MHETVNADQQPYSLSLINLTTRAGVAEFPLEATR